MSELWKPLIGFEERYQISSYGKIQSLIASKGAFNILKITPDRHNNDNVRIRGSTQKYKLRVDKLVLQTFIGGHHPFTIHKDGDKRNNNITNLEWSAVRKLRSHCRKGHVLTISNKHRGCKICRKALLDKYKGHKPAYWKSVKCLHCDDKPIAKGLCNRHYRAFKAHGDALWQPIKHAGCLCCARTHQAIGLCHACYRAWKRSGMFYQIFIELRRRHLALINYKYFKKAA